MSDYFDRVERQLVRSAEISVRRSARWPRRLMPVVAVAVVVAVVAVFLGVRGRAPSIHSAGPSPVVFTTPAGSGAALDQAANILRLRLGAVFHHVQVTRAGDRITASASGASPGQIEALAAPGRLAMWDWEASVLTPRGQTVASQLRTQNPSAIEISQGSGGASPGAAGAGGLPLYDAVSLAARQTTWARPQRSTTCSGPVPPPVRPTACSPARRPTQAQLLARAGGQRPELVVPRGIVVVEAAPSSFGSAPAVSDAAARFFVLRGAAVLTARELTDPRVGHGASGQPDVEFGFTSAGARAFRTVTAAAARRGAAVSSLGQTLDQHFAVTVDGHLVTVPSIDFRAYPDGISGGDGADLEAGFTTQSARELAALLRYGPLPVNLQPH